MAVFGPHYRHFGRHPALSRLALQELTFYSRGKQAAAFQEIRSRLLQALEGLMRAAQRSGALRPDVPAARLARMVFLVYSAAVRLWIAQPEPRPASGLLELRKLLSLALEGMSGAAARPG
jgi:hypothetical protein